MVKVKEWLTFWLFLFVYSFTFIISLLEFFKFRILDFGYYWILVFWVIFLFGILLRIYTRKLLGEFFDLNIKVQKNHVIVKEGIYAYVRHPMYLANILIFLGIAGFFSSIVGVISALVLVVPVTLMRIVSSVGC
tara:strand:+ start:316 stop:717 length:402 start_codon:yes stop_codon:yes gene_type:complete